MIPRLTIDAFAATPETAAVLRQVQIDRQLGKSQVAVEAGGLSAAVARYAQSATPQVVVVEENDPALLLEQLEQLAEVCEPRTRVVVIGSVNDIALYRSLIGGGVSEYLVRPVTARQLVEALSGLFSDPATAPKGRVIACWGARGGVGSSTLAQNLAWGLGRFLRETVVYIDLDLAFGTSVLAFNIDFKQTVADVLVNPERLDEVLIERCMVDYDEHLQILASPGDCRIHAGISLDSLDHMIDLAARMASVVVLDIPHVWADWTEHLLSMADEVVVTAVPDFASLRDAKSLIDVLAPRRAGAAPLRLVLNKVDPSRKTQLAAKDFEETIKLVPSLLIPSEPQVFGEAANNGQMVGEAAKTHKVNQVLNQLVESLAGKAPSSRKGVAKPGLLGQFARLLGR